MTKLPEHVLRAIICGPTPKIRNWRKVKQSNLTRAERNMKFIETFCIVPEGRLQGKPVALDIFQEAFVYSIYDNPHGTSEAYLSEARKNAKTALIAMLVLVHLVGPEAFRNSEIMSGARSREQAGQVYKYASKMVMDSEKLSKYIRIVPSGKKLIGLPLNVEYSASSAEAKTAHGGSPIVAILDELGQVRGNQDDYVDAIITSQGAYDNALLIGISTQAPNDADLLSVILDDAKSSKDPHIVAHLYESDEDCEIMDERQWLFANPALGKFRSEQEFRKLAAKAARMPSFENTFRNLYLNQRVEVTAPFVSKSVWVSCGGEVAEIDPSLPIWGGLDLSQRTDLTALVLAQKQNGIWQVWVYFWTPEVGLRERSKKDRAPYDQWVKAGKIRTTPGATVDYSYVAQEILDLTEGLDVKGISFDRWRIDDLKKELAKIEEDIPEEERLRLVMHGQGFKDMSPSIEALEAELLNARIAHGMHPVLTMCASNALVVHDPTKARKFEKAKSTGRIDGLVSLAMAIGIASREDETEEPKPEHQLFFLQGLYEDNYRDGIIQQSRTGMVDRAGIKDVPRR